MIIKFLIGAPASGKTTYLSSLVSKDNVIIIDDPENFETDINLVLLSNLLFLNTVVYISDHHLSNFNTILLAINKLEEIASIIHIEYIIFNKPLSVLKQNLMLRNLTEYRNISEHYLKYNHDQVLNLIKTFDLHSIPYTLV